MLYLLIFIQCLYLGLGLYIALAQCPLIVDEDSKKPQTHGRPASRHHHMNDFV